MYGCSINNFQIPKTMKRVILPLLLLLATACNKVNDIDNPTDGIGIALDISLPTDSRVAFDSHSYSWQGGEQIGLYTTSATPTTNIPATVSVREGKGYCTANINAFANGDTLYAYMPHNSQSSSASSVNISIPATQAVEAAGVFPGSAMPMVAAPYTLTEGESASLTMQPLAGILCFNIYATGQYSGERVSSVRYATSTPVAGSCQIDLTAQSLTLPSLTEYSVTTTLSSHYTVPVKRDIATPIYIVVAPTALKGTLTITTDKAIYTYNYSRTVERNHYYDVNIDLSDAQYRKSLTEGGSTTATLTYNECKGVISGYKTPKTYTNNFGTWTICAYNFDNKAIQINSGKVAYVGTPTFATPATSISLTFTESYSDKIYICPDAGSTNPSSISQTINCSGTSVTADISELGISAFYIRSSACARISEIKIVYGADNGTILPDPTPEQPTPTPDPEPDPEPTPTPDPTPEPDPTPSTSAYSWAELPVIVDANGDGKHDSDSNIYYAHHLCAGGEKNAQGNGTARNYTVCYSGEHHCPLWVAAPRHSMYENKKTDRTDAYGVDPKIPSGIQYNSKSTGGGCNKGHMLGSAERLCSAATNRQVFYYTNIAPQYSSTFNTGGGAWNNLEDHIDGLVCSDTLYVVIGCYFDTFSRNGASASPSTISFGGRSDVSCPTMFYYALLRTKKGNSGKRVQDCTASELQCAAFTICHKMPKGHKPQAADMMSISELEALTGFKYFPNVPNAPKTTFSSSDWL